MPEYWISTDEASDVAGSIRHILRVGEFTDVDPQSWKWLALALHSALQGACVCHLTTSFTPIGAVTQRNATAWLAFHEERRTNPAAKPPKTDLMSLPDLLKAARKPHSAGDQSNAVGVQLSDAEFNWLRRFHNDIRNQFVHFAPMGWSIDVSGIPELAKLVARIIEEILSIGYAFRHQDSEWRLEMQRALQILATDDWFPKRLSRAS